MRSRSTDPRRTSGFTLIEVMVAIVILAVGLMGLAGSTTYIVRQVLVSELRTERMLAVQSAIERIRAAADDTLAGGVALIGEVDTAPELLATTDHAVAEVANGAVRYAGSVAKLLD